MRLKEYMNESSLSRLRQHMLEHDTGTITAFRDAEDCGNGPDITKKQNKARNKILLVSLRKEGYSITKVKGSYIENYGTNKAKEVGEEVFFVVDMKDKGNLKQKLMELGEKFEQDSVMYIPKGADKGMLIGTNHCPDGFPEYHKVVKLDNPIFGKGGEFMTKVKGRPFILNTITETIHPPQSNMGRWGDSILYGKDWREYAEELEDE